MWNDFVMRIRSIFIDMGNTLSFAPAWAVSVVILLAALGAAWLLHVALNAALRRLLRGGRPFLRSLLEETKNPTRFALLLIALAIALPAAPLDAETKALIGRFLLLGTICLLGWIALTAANISANLYLLQF